MELFNWKSEYSVENVTIDSQHKGLFNIINELFTAMRTGKTEEKTKIILKKLQQYTVSHFKYEEEKMKQYNYPDLNTHKQLHQSFVSRIETFIAESEAENKTISIDLLKLLKEWLQNHILKIDKQYTPFIGSDK